LTFHKKNSPQQAVLGFALTKVKKPLTMEVEQQQIVRLAPASALDPERTFDRSSMRPVGNEEQAESLDTPGGSTNRRFAPELQGRR
jgi:hypothetical protein